MFRFLFAGICLAPLAASAAEPVDFARDVKPLFSKHCLTCHGPVKPRGGLRLDDGKLALAGGNSGKVIVPGQADKSLLLRAVAGIEPDLNMPPKEKPRLSGAEIATLRAWIDQGAKWSESKPLPASQASAKHWSFQPPKRPALPAVKQSTWVHNDIDRFILARLEKEGIAPSIEADKSTLLRRLCFDLLGLPPTPKQIDEFLSDNAADAYERLVDRLLASPHYGERWGRHWLDAARYADSDGFEKDGGRPHAWRWRDWVIDALNRDVPFDRFTIEQLAGDLLPHVSAETRTATGFHRNTLTNKEGGVDQEQFRVEATIDRTNTTAAVWLGLTLGCAQCHDHKYDPLSQRDYYQFFAFFNNADEYNLPLNPAEEEKRKALEAQHKRALEAYKKNLPAAMARWEAALTPAELAKQPANLQPILKRPAWQRTEPEKKELAEAFQLTDSRYVELTKKHAAELKKLNVALAQTLREGPGRVTHVLIRGDFLRPGVEVVPGFPAVFGSRAQPPKNRLDLVKWLVSPDNPLTARVQVNWTWQKHFGRGLVATLEDFGTRGEPPSHPELLDWLATEFIRQNWSMKALHKLIVCSATYRQSSQTRPELRDRDPQNVLLARQNRLRFEAEVVRDNALAVSGLLTDTVGGPSVHPPQPAGISELTYANSAKWVESTGSDRYRRGLYIWFQRTSPYPTLMTFDAPDSNVCCVRREKSNTPLQALTLLNDAAFVECAQALGKRLAAASGDTHKRLTFAWKLCLGREPAAAELSRAAKLFDELRAMYQAQPEATAKLSGKSGTPETAAWVALARTLLNLDEFVTRE
ncbi:MAG: PSD1 and planctomycete cytochrome C domain-containing protein [Gemmataceae bacterium]